MRRIAFAMGLGLLLVVAALTLFNSQTQAQTSTGKLVTLMTTSGRSADVGSSDVTNFGETTNVRGAYIILNATAITASPRITLSVQAKDAVSGNYQSVFTSTTGLTAAGTQTFLLYPGIGSAAGNITQVQSLPLPIYWRVYIDHDDSDTITYTVGAQLLP